MMQKGLKSDNGKNLEMGFAFVTWRKSDLPVRQMVQIESKVLGKLLWLLLSQSWGFKN